MFLEVINRPNFGIELGMLVEVVNYAWFSCRPRIKYFIIYLGLFRFKLLIKTLQEEEKEKRGTCGNSIQERKEYKATA